MLAFLVAGQSTAWAAGDSCARFKDADAYNSCLAASGPAFHEGRFTQTPRAESVGKKARHGRTHRRAASGKWGRHSHGRTRIKIYPGE
jgi:hypothetical protein